MQNDLQQIIFELQQELHLLEHELKNCLDDHDYKGARKHQKAIGYTRDKLHILYNLENSDHIKITEAKGMLHRLNTMEYKGEYAQHFKTINEQQISVYEDILSRLEKKEKRYQLDSDEIRQGLELLLEKRANTISIQLPRATIHINFILQADSLQIKIAGIDSETRKSYLTQSGLIELKAMQFDLSEDEATKTIEQFSHDLIPDVLQLLSRVVFNVFRLYGDKMAILRM